MQGAFIDMGTRKAKQSSQDYAHHTLLVEIEIEMPGCSKPVTLAWQLQLLTNLEPFQKL